jgi:(4-(4-[2-(gamma-L-glutamylamino)ethyl]phenoxymethyl)furan-2-yl)methanamine synthase
MSLKLASTGPWLGLDVGGANIKVAHESGRMDSIPFALWTRPRELPDVLKGVVRSFPPHSRIALTMTAELCDCYASKAEGVASVLDAIVYASSGVPIHVWGIDGSFHDVATIRRQPLLAAAANWLALAHVAGRLASPGPGLLIDIGSTTSDLIPLSDGRPSPNGLSDTARLQTGELVYAGVRRTPICAIASLLPYQGMPTGVAAELFATTLDVYLTLGAISSDPSDLDTADGRPATAEAAISRLGRMVGADRETFGSQDAQVLAQAVDGALLQRLETAARQACRAVGPPCSAVLSGTGEFLGRRLAARLLADSAPIYSLGEIWEPAGSVAACARALLILAREAFP